MAAVCSSMFERIKMLGSGGYGQVDLVRKICGIDRGMFYALKTVSKDELRGKMFDDALAERKALEMTKDCPFICKLHYAFESPKSLFYVMEYVEGGTLGELMKKQSFNEYEMKFYAAEIVLAIQSLHSIGIIHRDLKPENILVTRHGHIKVADFGLCKLIKGRRRTYSNCGTLNYMAPEVGSRRGHGREVDWWALGVIMREMLSLGSGTPDLQDIITKLMERNYRYRLGTSRGAAEVKEHPFFVGLDWYGVQARVYQAPRTPEVDLGLHLKIMVTPMPNFFHFENLCGSRPGQDDLLFEGFEYVAPFVINAAQPTAL